MNNTIKGILILLFSLNFAFGVNAENENTKKVKVQIGGALRFNYKFLEWDKKHEKTGGEFNYDVFIINVKASYGKLSLVSDYRFYNAENGGRMFKFGYIAYDFDLKNQLQVGLSNVPFGAAEENFHNFFCNIDYYLGLNTDYDMGVKFSHKGESINYDLAFYKNTEDFGAGTSGVHLGTRYSYDIAGDYEEINSINARTIYKFGDKCKHELGVSLMYGGLYNVKTEQSNDRYAYSGHYQMTVSNWHIIAQYSKYNFSSEEKLDMVAFGGQYNVAPQGDIYTLALSYTQAVDFLGVTSLRFYNDFGFLDKRNDDYYDSYQNVTGCMITAGPIYSFVDCVVGKNQAWFGTNWNDAFLKGEKADTWNCRFNINIGYYF